MFSLLSQNGFNSMLFSVIACQECLNSAKLAIQSSCQMLAFCVLMSVLRHDLDCSDIGYHVVWHYAKKYGIDLKVFYSYFVLGRQP